MTHLLPDLGVLSVSSSTDITTSKNKSGDSGKRKDVQKKCMSTRSAKLTVDASEERECISLNDDVRSCSSYSSSGSDNSINSEKTQAPSNNVRSTLNFPCEEGAATAASRAGHPVGNGKTNQYRNSAPCHSPRSGLKLSPVVDLPSIQSMHQHVASNLSHHNHHILLTNHGQGASTTVNTHIQIQVSPKAAHEIAAHAVVTETRSLVPILRQRDQKAPPTGAVQATIHAGMGLQVYIPPPPSRVLKLSMPDLQLNHHTHHHHDHAHAQEHHHLKRSGSSEHGIPPAQQQQQQQQQLVHSSPTSTSLQHIFSPRATMPDGHLQPQAHNHHTLTNAPGQVHRTRSDESGYSKARHHHLQHQQHLHHQPGAHSSLASTSLQDIFSPRGSMPGRLLPRSPHSHNNTPGQVHRTRSDESGHSKPMHSQHLYQHLPLTSISTSISTSLQDIFSPRIGTPRPGHDLKAIIGTGTGTGKINPAQHSPVVHTRQHLPSPHALHP